MAANTAAQSAWPRAKLPIALSRVSCRGVFSQLKRCRVRNTIAYGGGLCIYQRRGGAQFSLRPIPGNGRVFDPGNAGYVLVNNWHARNAYDRDAVSK